MKKNYVNTLIGILFFSIVKSQVGIGTPNPSNSAVLELNSSNKGFLMNTISLTSTQSASPLTTHTEGIWVYNTATAGTAPNNVIPGLYYNDGAKWVLMSINTDIPKIGDIKSSMVNADHEGWYLMNGRNTSTLPASAQANAATIGLAATIPNTADRILKGKNTSEAFAATGGANSYTLSQTNLPNLTFTGNTSTDGAHVHTYTNRGVNYWNFNAGSLSATRTINTETRTTGTAGNHSHTFSVASGGTSAPIAQYPKHMVVQYFIYLGK